MKMLLVSAFILCMLFPPMFPAIEAAEHAVTAGYGFGALNIHKHLMKIEGGKNYDFFQTSYLYERPCHHPKVAVVFEPFAALINRPSAGVDVGFNIGIRWYPFDSGKGLYLSPQTGMAYTSIKFHEQGTHLLFILQATLGFRYKNFFVEDRFKHYSNGHTASPNRSVHSNVVAVGMYF